MRQKIFHLIRVFILCCSISFYLIPLHAQVAVSESGGASSAGDVAGNLTTLTHGFTYIFAKLFYVLGAMLIMAGFIQYRQFKQNPLQTPLSRVIVIFVAGIIIAFFPFAAQWITQHLSQYSI